MDLGILTQKERQEIMVDGAECSPARFPADVRLKVMRARLKLLVYEWEDYNNPKEILQDILKEPSMLFD